MFFSPFERMVAGRYLRSRKQEGFVSVIAGFSFLGIMLGVATLIIVMSVMNGFRQELIGRILGLNGHINVYSPSGRITDYDMLAINFMDVDDIVQAFPVIESQALMSIGGASTGVIVRGLQQDSFTKKPILSDGIIVGKIENFTDNKIAIGSEIAKRYGLSVGDKLNLIAPQGKAGPFGTMPRSRSYEVGLVFDVNMYEYNSGFVFMPLKAAQTFFQYPDAVSAIEIITKDPAHMARAEAGLKAMAPKYYEIRTWHEMNGSFFNALQVERNVMFLILTLIILVAAFNIISSMIMLVKDKGHDIAIMRTMGATRRNMMKIFILTGASIGLVGTGVGAALGITFALNIEAIRQWLQGLTGTDLFSAEIYFLSKLPAVVEWHEVAAVVGIAFTLSILATLYPAWRAARLDPVEALRYE